MTSYISKIGNFFSNRRKTVKAIGMIASANLLGTALGVVGSLVQARFISPDDLGFVRKYTVISGYAIFLSFGLFTILQREYPVLMGSGEEEQARRVAAIGHSWSILTSVLVSSALMVICIAALLQGQWKTAAAWFIQVVSVWSILYGGYLTCTFRSGHEFERLAKSSFLSSLAGIVVVPLFFVLPFTTLVLRSIFGSIVTNVYLHAVRPLKVGICLPARELLSLFKRGMRLFVGSYVRYTFWLTVEIWLLIRFAGDSGVGLFVFSSMIVTAVGQLATAVNQIYMPRLAQHYGRTGSLDACLRMTVKPTLVNVLSAILFSVAAWLFLPPVLKFAFPRYIPAIPLINVLLLDTIIVGLSLPLYMVPVLEDYATQLVAALVGLAVFVGFAGYLHSTGMREMAVVWGTITGRLVFVLVSIVSLAIRKVKIGNNTESLISA